MRLASTMDDQHKLILLVIFLWGTFPLVLTNDDVKCPTADVNLRPCQCLSGGPKGIDFYCANSNLGTIALTLSNLKVPINTLRIQDSNIARVFGAIFKGTSIHSLTIENSNVIEIDSDSLHHLKSTLKELKLDKNFFKAIPDAINSALPNLTKLMVINTDTINEVRSSSLKKLTSLIELDLHGNSIKKVEATSFTPMLILGMLQSSLFVCWSDNSLS